MTASASRLIIFDTTLRDGEQSPGASMTREEKIRIATVLEKMRVDVIEAGFAAASQGDSDAINAIARTIKDSTVCSLARALKHDIDAAAKALEGARQPRIHTFIATSPIHMMHKLKMEPNAVLEQAERAVKAARQYTDDVEFSCEDAGRSELDFLCRIIELAIDAGATTINIPDTVGYAVPAAFGDMVRNIIERVPNSDKAIFSVHCHNDLGLAVANSLAAVINGARQVECTVNGLGERAGNAALEEIVMAVRTRQDLFPVDTRLDTRQIVPASRLVSSITGFPVQPNKAIVGANAFAHESGIHQDGVLKHRETYEIMSAQDVGWRTNRMVLGKHSGRNAFRSRLQDLGYTFTGDTDLAEAFARFKTLADKKHDIYDEDLHALMAETAEALSAPDFIRLKHLSCASEMGRSPKASVVLEIEGREETAEAHGDGPVDACFKAVDSLVHSGTTLQLYSVNAITAGTEAQGEVSVRLEKGGRIVNGAGSDTDIVVASVKAYIKALNLMLNSPQREHPQITV